MSSPDLPKPLPELPRRSSRLPGRPLPRPTASPARQGALQTTPGPPLRSSGELPGLQKTYGFLKDNLQFPLERSTRAPPAQDRADGAAGGHV